MIEPTRPLEDMANKFILPYIEMKDEWIRKVREAFGFNSVESNIIMIEEEMYAAERFVYCFIEYDTLYNEKSKWRYKETANIAMEFRDVLVFLGALHPDTKEYYKKLISNPWQDSYSVPFEVCEHLRKAVPNFEVFPKLFLDEYLPQFLFQYKALWGEALFPEVEISENTELCESGLFSTSEVSESIELNKPGYIQKMIDLGIISLDGRRALKSLGQIIDYLIMEIDPLTPSFITERFLKLNGTEYSLRSVEDAIQLAKTSKVKKNNP